MMQGSLAWNWRTDVLCFHLLFYLSASRSSVISWVSHSLKSSQAVFSLLLPWSTFSSSRHRMAPKIEAPHFRDTWKTCVCVCVCEAESLWLRERDLPLTCSKNMSRRMGDKGVLGRGCQQKWISAGKDTTHATVQWFAACWQLFTATTFQTLRFLTLSLK